MATFTIARKWPGTSNGEEGRVKFSKDALVVGAKGEYLMPGQIDVTSKQTTSNTM